MTGIAPARRVAYETLRRTFEDGAWTDRAFASLAARQRLEGRELGQARRLAYGATQRRGTTDHLLEDLAGRPLTKLDPPATAALRLGAYELLFASAVPDHAAVDQAVELAKAGMRRDGAPPARARAAAGLVNAVLRRAAAERERLLGGLDDAEPERAAIALSYPVWLAEMWWEQLGAAGARTLMAAMNEPAETTFRANTLRADPERLRDDLRRVGVEVAEPAAGGLLDPPEAVVVALAGDPVTARVATGELVPQSRGSQAVVELLGPRPGERVLDLCAGPGIKTTQIAARMGNQGELVSVELDPRRAEAMRELCDRTGAEVARVEVGDAAEIDLGSGYDRVLVDPPCSDLGTLASRPDARWRKSPEQVERLAALQRRILVRGARALAPGGTIVYSTCTISRRENEAVISETRERVGELSLDDLGSEHARLTSLADRRCLQLRPDRDRTTGFFIARLRREPA